jgi:hypothetical protein
VSAEPRTAADVPLPGGDFRLFVQKLAYQGLIGLGLIENPITKSVEPNLDHARALIEDLMMLREKTEGNLGADEAAHLAKVLSDLQFHFARLTKQKRGAAG